MTMDAVQVGFRIPTSLLKAIDAHVEWMHKHKPHQRYTRTDAIRDLVAFGLEHYETLKRGMERKK